MTKKNQKVKEQKSNDKESDDKELRVSQEELTKVLDEKNELLSSLQRLQAEFENFKKRNEKEKEDFKNYASANLMESFLPIVDNFELALKAHESKDDFYKGIELIYAQIMSFLKDQGLEIIKCEGKFNPREHEALMMENKEGFEAQTIIEVLQPGYKIKDKILRTAKVKVAK